MPKLSAIAAGTTPISTDTVIGVQGGATDVQFTVAQISATATVTPGSTSIISGTNTRVFFDDNGKVNESAGLTYSKGAETLTVQSGSSPEIQVAVAPTGITISPDIVDAASQPFTLKSKAVADLSTGLAVAYLVPGAGSNVWMALDISPLGTPSDSGGRGTAWIDICSTNETVTEGGTYGCLSLGKYNSGDKHGLVDVNTAVSGVPGSAPLYIQPSGGTLYIGSTTPYSAGGAQVQITKNSTSIGTENAGLAITTGAVAQPELMLGVDNGKTYAYIQSASTGTNFTTVPLALNPNGATIGIGSSSGTIDIALARNASGVLEINSGTAGTLRDLKVRSLVTSGGMMELSAYTVATLPIGRPAGSVAYVTDALSPTFLGTLAGGGSVRCPVFYNGTAWVAG